MQLCYDRAASMEQGSIIGDRYVLERHIGEGGMATVWRARDRTLRRSVAIKFLWARERRGQKDLVKAFLREARIAASVHHANVVQVLDFGLHEADVPYMVMEALEGETLGDQFNAGAVYSMEQVLHIAAGTLEGIIAVHEAGIVHRDLKPENIFLVPQRHRMQPKLLDFGISRAVDNSTGLRSAVTTQEGRVIGTPEYMSPEQARGVADVDARTDLYSMGVILYEMIVGDVPYKDPHFGDLIIKIVQGGAPTVADVVPSVGSEVSELVERSMALKREDRFQDAAEMYDALLKVAEPFGGTQAVLGMPSRVERVRGTQSGRMSTTGDDGLEMHLGPSAGAGLHTQSGPPTQPPPSDADLDDLPGNLSPSGATTTPEPTDIPARAGGPRWVPVVAVLAALAAGAAVVTTLREPAGEQEPRFIVVQGAPTKAESAPEPAPPEPPVAAAAPAEPEPLAAEEPPTPEPKAKPAKARAVKKPVKASRAQLLAGAFKRQKSNVVKCLRTHGDIGEASISVRVQVNTGGKVELAQVLPKAAAATAAGKCVQQAVGVMRFGAQPTPASFRVPLYVTHGG